MKTAYRTIKETAARSETWLEPYVGYTCKIKKYSDGRLKFFLDGWHDMGEYARYFTRNRKNP